MEVPSGAGCPVSSEREAEVRFFFLAFLLFFQNRIAYF
jgi:hypothetical protein